MIKAGDCIFVPVRGSEGFPPELPPWLVEELEDEDEDGLLRMSSKSHIRDKLGST